MDGEAPAQRCQPKAAGAFLRALFEVDVRAVLPLVQAPTLILHRRDLQVIPAAHGRYLAQHIPGARFIELPGSETSLVWETPELVLDHVEEFLTGARRAAEPERMLATVLFTDIVGPPSRSAGWATAAGVGS
jgi:pimeloyl-ACP methyl ester carboxylesterase